MTGGWLVDDWWMTGGWLVDDWWMTGGWLVDDWWMTSGWLVDDWCVCMWVCVCVCLRLPAHLIPSAPLFNIESHIWCNSRLHHKGAGHKTWICVTFLKWLPVVSWWRQRVLTSRDLLLISWSFFSSSTLNFNRLWNSINVKVFKCLCCDVIVLNGLIPLALLTKSIFVH